MHQHSVPQPSSEAAFTAQQPHIARAPFNPFAQQGIVLEPVRYGAATAATVQSGPARPSSAPMTHPVVGEHLPLQSFAPLPLVAMDGNPARPPRASDPRLPTPLPRASGSTTPEPPAGRFPTPNYDMAGANPYGFAAVNPHDMAARPQPTQSKRRSVRSTGQHRDFSDVPLALVSMADEDDAASAVASVNTGTESFGLEDEPHIASTLSDSWATMCKCHKVCTVGYLSFGPIENILCFCDLCAREKDWHRRACGTKAT